MQEEPTPFEWVERKTQTFRTAKLLADLASNPTLRPYIVFDVDTQGNDVIGGCHLIGAVGSMNYVRGICSRCGNPVRRARWRIEVFALYREHAPIAFQFGERFCSEKCGDEFAKDFIRFGLRFQPISKTPDKSLVRLELNATTNPALN